MKQIKQKLWNPLQYIALCGLMLSLVMLAGCGDSGPPRITGSVKITVMYDNKPVTEGEVSMVVPNSGKGASGTLGADGTVTIDEVEVGDYVVSVTPPSPPDPDPENPAPPAKAYDNLPEKFRSETTSTLKASVKADVENTFTFELKE